MTQADTQEDEFSKEPEADQEGQAEQNQEDDQSEGDEQTGQEDQQSEGDDDELEIRIEGESPPPEEDEQVAPQWVRDVRKDNREKAKRIRELEAKLAANQPQPQAVTVGPKPTMAEYEYEEDRYADALESWHERKRQAEAEAQKKRDEATNAQKAWQTKLDDYGKQKSTLKVRDFEDAEAQAQEVLSVTQQGIILSGADAPAMLVYALGKNPKKAKELASISDPVKFAVAIGKLETQLKATPRKAAPLPESAVKGSGRAVNNQTLERLESEAMRSGDRSKVIAYKRQMKAKT